MTRSTERAQANGHGSNGNGHSNGHQNGSKYAPQNRLPLTDMLDRQPPYDIQAETGLLGSIILLPEVLDDVVRILPKSEAFYDDAHRRLYDHLLAMYEAGRKFDDTLLTSRLKDADEFDLIGGSAYLAKIVNAVPNAAHAVYYAQIVRDKALKRAVIYKATELLRDGYESLMDADALIAQADTAFAELSDGALTQGDVASVNTIAIDALAALERRVAGEVDGLPTGIAGFDQVCRLRKGTLNIIAGRTAMGKSAIVGNVAVHVAKQNQTVLYVSLEMRQVELMDRMLCAEARVSFHRILNGTISCDDRSKLIAASETLGQLKLFIDDKAEQTVSQIAAQARRLRRKHGLDLMIVDYLQLIEPDNPKDSRQEQVSKITRKLKLLSRTLDIPIIALAQLNRQAEGTKDSRPKLSHLRESGAIEQDADTVLFVHRPAYYSGSNSNQQNGNHQNSDTHTSTGGEKAEVLLAKGRNCPTVTIDMHWFGHWMRWDNPAQERHEQYAPYQDGGF